jgi:NTE family protein
MQATAHMLGRAADREVAAQAGRCDLYLVPAPVVTDVSPFRFGRSAELMDSALATARTWLETAAPVPPVCASGAAGSAGPDGRRGDHAAGYPAGQS